MKNEKEKIAYLKFHKELAKELNKKLSKDEVIILEHDIVIYEIDRIVKSNEEYTFNAIIPSIEDMDEKLDYFLQYIIIKGLVPENEEIVYNIIYLDIFSAQYFNVLTGLDPESTGSDDYEHILEETKFMILEDALEKYELEKKE